MSALDNINPVPPNNMVNIEILSNGCVVRVGCVCLVYSDINELAGDLKQYLADPEKYAEKYREHGLRNAMQGQAESLGQMLQPPMR